MLDKRRKGLLAVVFVLVVIALEVGVLKLGSLDFPLTDPPAVAEHP